MANYKFIDPKMGNDAPSASQSFATSAGIYAKWPFGMTAAAQDMSYPSGAADTSNSTYVNMGIGEFQYCQGSNVASGGQFVMVSNNSAVLLNSANSTCFWPIGLAAAPMTATNVGGWVQYKGLADYARVSNTDVPVNNRVALASTAGQIGTVTALGSGIRGINFPVSCTSARATASLTVYLNSPFIIGVTASN